jgi:hypothetical protein
MKERDIQPEVINPADEKLTDLSIKLKAKTIRDLRTMEKNTKKSVDELVATAVAFFIATHNDYLGIRR